MWYCVVVRLKYKNGRNVCGNYVHTLIYRVTLSAMQSIVILLLVNCLGTPLAPTITDIKLIETKNINDKSYSLTFSWEAEQNELRPINTFSGTITPINKRKNRSISPSGRRVEAEDENSNLLPAMYSFTVDNNTNEYTVEDILFVREYKVEVCSHNTRGVNCSTPVNYNIGVEDEEEDNDLPAGVIVSIVFMVIFILIFCCLCFICLLCFWCWPSEWRSYYPERKGKIEKST